MKNFILILMLFLSACTANNNLPLSIENPPANDLRLAYVVLDNTENFIGQEVRWGGKIIITRNENGLSEIEIEQFPLNRFGFPLTKLGTEGNFIAQSEQLLDPELYQEGLFITFSAIIKSERVKTERRKETYLPVVSIKEAHLWPFKISNGKAYPTTGQQYQHRFMNMPSNY
jgi:outer membrane lipoprotein